MKATPAPVSPPRPTHRRDRLLRDSRHDPYRARRKLADPTACPDCEAVYHEGRWQWGAAPSGAATSCCPACQRIRDDYPAGHVIAKGVFLDAHRAEILALARHVEERESALHPLHRIMDAHTDQHALVIRTTDVHLARAIGDAIADAYQGDLRHQYSEEEHLIRVTWSRDA